VVHTPTVDGPVTIGTGTVLIAGCATTVFPFKYCTVPLLIAENSVAIAFERSVRVSVGMTVDWLRSSIVSKAEPENWQNASSASPPSFFDEAVAKSSEHLKLCPPCPPRFVASLKTTLMAPAVSVNLEDKMALSDVAAVAVTVNMFELNVLDEYGSVADTVKS
jgi:hypothetical protein